MKRRVSRIFLTLKSFIRELNEFAPILLSLYVQILLLRGYEWVQINKKHSLPIGSFEPFIRGVLFEVYNVAFIGGILFTTFFILQKSARKVALFFTLGSGTIILLWNTALIDYFVVSLNPLGVEIFAYGPSEIIDTAVASADFSFFYILPYLLVIFGFPGMVLGLASLFPDRSKDLSVKVGYGIAAWFILGTLIGVGLAPGDTVQKPLKRHLFQNKLILFAEAVKKDIYTSSVGKYGGAQYPLLRPVDSSDVLSANLELGSRPPDIVVVIVEGLSKSFLGPQARWGGFAPYLDSLRHRSLYWPNALSTSGSSFNVVPSLFASLPYDGEYYAASLADKFGWRLPNHRSLISILSKNGYRSRFYTGFDASFNNIDEFLKQQQVGKIVDQNDFGSGFRSFEETLQDFRWGYPDKAIVRRVISDIDTAETSAPRYPRLEIVRTTSLHLPFDIPKKKQYLQEARQRISQLEVHPKRKEEYRTYEEVFATLLYTDDAVKLLIDSYSRRPSYDQTLFVITGDHHPNGSVPSPTELGPYRVPLLLFSPMVEEPETFPSVASHLQVTPTLLAHLTSHYDITQPDSVHWLGGPMDTSSTFKSNVTLPLMREKDQLDDFVDGSHLLADNRAYTIQRGLTLEPAGSEAKRSLKAKLQAFRRMNQYVVRENKLLRRGGDTWMKRGMAQKRENQKITSQNLEK